MYNSTDAANSSESSNTKGAKCPPWALHTRKMALQVSALILAVTVVVVPIELVKSYHERMETTPPDRIRCLQRGVNASECQRVGCFWSPQGDAPSCFYPPSHAHGYSLKGHPDSSIPGVTKVNLTLKETSAKVVDDLKITLQVEVIEYGKDLFRIKVIVPEEERFQVPIPLDLPPVATAVDPQYKVSLGGQHEEDDFTISITRILNGQVLFDTSIGGFTFGEQFLQISTKLPSSFLYGLGEHLHQHLTHDLSYLTWPMFASDQPPGKAEENLYGVHPMYQVLEEDGSSHIVLLLNSNAMEAETMPLPGLTLRAIGGVLDLFFFMGPSPTEALQQYLSVVGRPFLPPYWALGFQLCRYGYNTLDNMKSAVSRTRRAGIPQDVQYADIDHMDRRLDFTYDSQAFANLPEYIADLKRDGVHFVLILDPAINAELSGEEYPVHQRALAKDVYIKWPKDFIPDVNYGSGDIMLGYVWPDNRTAFPDFFRNSTHEWWNDEITRLQNILKFDGLWIDMNEPANFGTNEETPWNWPDDWPHWSLKCPFSKWDDPPFVTLAASAWGKEKRLSEKTLCMVGLQGEDRQLRHYDVHNLYGWSQSLPTLRALQTATGRRGLVVSRSTYPSSGRWAGHWLGDNTATWEHLRASLIGIMEFNIFGIPYIGADICGFFGNTTEDLCARWMQLGAFYPYSRSHNALGTNDHDPGLWPSVASSGRSALRVRYTLLPYLYTLHYLATTKGHTVVRPLFYEFPVDANARAIDDQFLWGSWLMIAPVLQHHQATKKVYFPEGQWFDFYNGRTLNVSQATTQIVDAPGTHIPLFVRGGGILVTQRPRANTVLSRSEPLGLVVAPNWTNKASGMMYWDDGDSLDPFGTGEYFTANVSYENRTITWRVEHPHDSLVKDLVLSDMRIFALPSRPTHVLLGGTRWNVGDSHYNTDTQVLELFDLGIPVGKDFSLTLGEEMNFRIPCPISFNNWDESVSVTKEVCETRNCVWDPEEQVPCSVPPITEYGYEFVSDKMIVTDLGFWVELKKRGPTLYGNDAEIIVFEVFNYSDDTLRFKLSQKDVSRYEVPLDINSPKSGTQEPLYQVIIADQRPGNPFFFYIIRKDTGAILFDTRIGGLTFSDQYLSVTTMLPSKNIYGLGENTHDSFRHRFDSLIWPIFARDQGPTVDAGQLNLYGAHPYYQCLENDGQAHGVLLLNSNALDYQMLDYPAISYRTIGGILDFYMVLGPGPEDVVSQYTSLIHRPFLPPYWALGFQLCRYGYKSLEDLQMAVNRTRDAGIPQDVQYGDIDYMDQRMDFTYDHENYAGFPEYIREVKKDGLRFIVILDPAINAEMPKGEYPTHERALDADAYIKWNDDADPNLVQENNGGMGQVMLGYVWPQNKTAFPNFFKASTQDWWINEIRTFYNQIKFDGLWIDMNEPANFGTNEEAPWNWPEGWSNWSLKCPISKWDDPPYVTKAGSLGTRRLSDKTLCMAAAEEPHRHYNVHNLYGWAQTEPSFRASQSSTRKRSLVISRSTFPSSGRWAGHWLGDNRSIWPDMHHSIIGMLEFNLFGIPYVGADVCGFFGNTTEELCERWMELGAFYPFARNHNHYDAADQDPGMWPETVGNSSKMALEIRYRLLPYLYTLFFWAHTKGATVVRPLLHEFPGDRRTLNVDDQFLWGGGFMISPLLEEGKEERLVYFPFDAWYDYYSGSPVEWPGEWMRVDAPRNYIPLHIRGGFILPTQLPDMNTFLSRHLPLGLIVAIGRDRKAEGHLFWDDGESIDTVRRKEYGLLEFTFIQDILRMRVVEDGDLALGGLTLEDLEFLGVELQPEAVELDQRELDQESWRYDPDTLKLTVKVHLDLNKAFELKLKRIWYYNVISVVST